LECGCSSGVEHNLAKVGVGGSNPLARSNIINHLAGFRTPPNIAGAEWGRNVFGGRSRRARAQATREFAETLLHISKYHWHADAEHRRRKIVAKLIEGGKYFEGDRDART
jgi:hypothetical protein